jgi:hypothetical protein
MIWMQGWEDEPVLHSTIPGHAEILEELEELLSDEDRKKIGYGGSDIHDKYFLPSICTLLNRAPKFSGARNMFSTIIIGGPDQWDILEYTFRKNRQLAKTVRVVHIHYGGFSSEAAKLPLDLVTSCCKLMSEVEVLTFMWEAPYIPVIAALLPQLKILRMNMKGLKDTSDKDRHLLSSLEISELWLNFKYFNDIQFDYFKCQWDTLLYGVGGASESALLRSLSTLCIHPQTIKELEAAVAFVKHCPVLKELRLIDFPSDSCYRGYPVKYNSRCELFIHLLQARHH